MKVLLFEIKSQDQRKCVNKDLAGGMGTATWVGDSIRANIFERTKRSNVILPNITISYLCAIFKKYNWEVEYQEIDKEVHRETADLALVHVSIVDAKHELEIIKKLKEQGYYVGVFGTFASVQPDFFLEAADFAIKGEAEAGVIKIAQEKILPKGIFEAGQVENLDDLPFPDWNQFPLQKYSYSPALNKKPVLTMLASRGCSYSCGFYCPYIIQAGTKWRKRSPENIINEIIYLIKNFKIKALDFRDPIFTLDRNRTLEMVKMMQDNKFNIIWSCETRLDRLDKILIKEMHKGGLRHINIGIESASDEVLKKSKRLPIKLEHQEDILNYCHSLGISIAAFYILGMDNDTEESINSTIAYAKKLNTLVVQFTISTPYPGTKYYDELQAQNKIETCDWEKFDAYTPIFKHNNLTSQELLKLKEKAFVSYYFNLKYLFKHMPKYFWEKYIWPH